MYVVDNWYKCSTPQNIYNTYDSSNDDKYTRRGGVAGSAQLETVKIDLMKTGVGYALVCEQASEFIPCCNGWEVLHITTELSISYWQMFRNKQRVGNEFRVFSLELLFSIFCFLFLVYPPGGFPSEGMTRKSKLPLGTLLYAIATA